MAWGVLIAERIYIKYGNIVKYQRGNFSCIFLKKNAKSSIRSGNYIVVAILFYGAPFGFKILQAAIQDFVSYGLPTFYRLSGLPLAANRSNQSMDVLVLSHYHIA